MNPILDLDFYMADAEPKVFGDTLYLYGSHDLYNGYDYCLGELYCAYSKLNDLKNFKLQKILTFEDSGHSFEDDFVFQAPDVAYNNGKYYLYDNRGRSGRCDIAISDSPLGPFKNYGFVQKNDGTPIDVRFFDPGILVDDDGKIYLYTGFCPYKTSRFAHIANPYSQVMELDKDMKTVISGPFNLIPGPMRADGTDFEGHSFLEASSIRKFNGKYYFIYSSELSHELCYAISDSPINGFKYGGTLISNANIGFKGNKVYDMPYGNTHGSICKINDEYYITFHRQTTGMETSRQTCMQKIMMDNEGRFIQAEYTTAGIEEILSDNIKFNATRCSYLKGDLDNPKLTVGLEKDKTNDISTIRENSGVHYINIIGNTTIGYKYFNFKNASKLILNLTGKKGTVSIYQDLKDKPLGFIDILNNKDLYEMNIDFKKGNNPLYIRIEDSKDVKFFELELK